MKKSTISIISVIGLALVAILFLVTNSKDEDKKSLTQDINIKELVHEHSLYGVPGEVAVITGTELIIKDNDGNNEKTYPLPDDEFFVSIAPYISVTHP